MCHKNTNSIQISQNIQSPPFWCLKMPCVTHRDRLDSRSSWFTVNISVSLFHFHIILKGYKEFMFSTEISLGFLWINFFLFQCHGWFPLCFFFFFFQKRAVIVTLGMHFYASVLWRFGIFLVPCALWPVTCKRNLPLAGHLRDVYCLNRFEDLVKKMISPVIFDTNHSFKR